MIPNVATVGKSFSGAGLYYLHDKREDQAQALAGGNDRLAADLYYLHDKGAQSSDRVVFAETLNLPTRDPHKAMKCMAWTAGHAPEIRQAHVAAEAQAAGQSYDDYVREHNPFRGRKGEKPVYAYSLSWHPDQKVDRAEMVAAARETLDVLGLKGHQAVLVAHNDTPHPHIHVICNRVHPQTGLYASRSRDHLTLSRWAEDYERRCGRILCFERVYNNADRQKEGFLKAESISRADRDWFDKHKHRTPEEIRSSREQAQSADRMALESRRHKQEGALEKRLKRTHDPAIRKVRAQIADLEMRMKMAEADRKAPATGVVQSLAKAIRAIGRTITDPPRKQRTALASLRSNLDRLEQSKEDARKAHKDAYAASWGRLERRHVVERERDEDRIERLLKAREAREKGDRGKGQFNVRGDPEAARYLRPDVSAQKARQVALEQVAGAGMAQEIRQRTATGRLQRTLGGGADYDERSRKEALSHPGSRWKSDPAADKAVQEKREELTAKEKTRNRNRSRGERTRTRSRRPKSD